MGCVNSIPGPERYINKQQTRNSPTQLHQPPQSILSQHPIEPHPSNAAQEIKLHLQTKSRIVQAPKAALRRIEEKHRQQRIQNEFKYIYEEDIYDTKSQDQNVIYEDQNCVGGEVLYQVTDRDFKADRFHSYIGSLLTYNSLNKTKEIKGSAVLIAPNLILTVAHNFYDKLNDVQNVDGKFYLGLNGKLGKYYEIESIFYPQEYEVLQNADCDYAIAKLKTNVTEVKEANFMTLGFGFNDKKASLSVFGYPVDENYKVVDKSGNREAYQKGLCREELRSIENNIISYRISTSGGQSGCPIITGINKNVIVGVHKAGAKDLTEVYNIGRYVGIDMILRMEIWRQKCRADKFKVMDLATNSQIDLASPLFKELKEMYKNQQRKMSRMKKIFQHNINTKQSEMQDLQRKIRQQGGFSGFDPHSIIKQNSSLKSRLYEQQTQLKKLTFQKKQLSDLNKYFKEELNCYKSELANMIPNSQHTEIVKTFTEKISHLEFTLQTKEELIEKTKEKIMTIKENANHVIEWDPNSAFAEKFKIDNARLSMWYDDGKYQMVAKEPFLKNRKTTVVFKLLKYGGKYEIGMGILCQSRRKSQISGRHHASVGYFTKKQGEQGFVYVDASLKQQKQKEQYKGFFIPENGELQMVVDLIRYQVTFTNRNEGGRFCKIGLTESVYKKEQIYAFCQLYCTNDMIMTVK